MTRYELSDVGVDNLVFGIIRRAYLDYYNSCILPEKLPHRPHVKYLRKGKEHKRLMTDHEFHLYLVEREMKRRRRKEDSLKFMRSKWYKVLCGSNDNGERIERIIAEIERKRKLGVKLFEDDDEQENDFESEDEI